MHITNEQKEAANQMCIDKKIYQDTHGNVVFVGTDENNEPKFACMRGTNTNKPFKGDCFGSDKRYAFSMEGSNREKLYVFEAPIDLLSHKVKELFPDRKIPTVEYLKERQTKLREQYAQSSAEYNFYKKEADRLAQQIQKKRQSQNTALRYLQNEQAAKRKKSQLE